MLTGNGSEAAIVLTDGSTVTDGDGTPLILVIVMPPVPLLASMDAMLAVWIWMFWTPPPDPGTQLLCQVQVKRGALGIADARTPTRLVEKLVGGTTLAGQS